jgi:23S rRNA (guanosine2251-2'-O)-methyltransferase
MKTANPIWSGREIEKGMGDSRKDSEEYLKKKRFLRKILTIYGRNAVEEALDDESLRIYRLHLSVSNRASPQLGRMEKKALSRGVEILRHDKNALSRISGNGRQDQGVALDIEMENFPELEEFVSQKSSYRIMALDRVTNPQNLGMIVRSCTAGNVDALLLPEKGCASISPLVVKASVGTIFKLPIVRVKRLASALNVLREDGASLYTLDSSARLSYRELPSVEKSVFILGNESDGVSEDIVKMCDEKISIPMNRGVESLNVAVTASIVSLCMR